jgi:transcriptional regulator with XRE-family HTH domain
MRAAAAKAGVSPTAWSDLEAGKHPPSLTTQRGVCQALGWTPDSIDRILVGGEPQLIQPALQAEDVLGEVRELVAGMYERQEHLIRQVASLLEAAERQADPDPQAQHHGD